MENKKIILAQVADLSKALSKLSSALNSKDDSEIIRDGTIQRFEYIRMRNLASHTYNEKLAEEVYLELPNFEKDANMLLDKINRKIIQ